MNSKFICLLLMACFFMSSCSEEQGVTILEVDTGFYPVEEPVKPVRNTSLLSQDIDFIMALVIPTANRQWFVKMTGPMAEFTESKAMLDKIRTTIRFDEYSVEVVTLDLAEGWQMRREKGFIHSSISHPNLKLKFTISSAKGSLLDNVNRWYKQLGMAPINEFRLTQIASKMNINGYFALAVLVGKDFPPVSSNHPPRRSTADQTAASAGPQGIRIAFGIVEEQSWYIKMSGDPNTLITERKNFESFVTDMKFNDGKASWVKPPGWNDIDGGTMAVAAFAVGAAKVTVTPLPAESGSVVANINRWRRQINLAEASEEVINKNLQKLQVDGHDFHYLFLSNTTNDGSASTGQSQYTGSDSKEVTFTTPYGWQELAPTSMRRVNLKASGMDVTGIFLGEAAKGLQKNVNRWCEQVGVAPFSSEQLAEAAQQIPFNNSEARYVFIQGTEQSILAVVYETAEGAWFFKVLGATDKIINEKSNFEKFVSSIKIKEVK